MCVSNKQKRTPNKSNRRQRRWGEYWKTYSCGYLPQTRVIGKKYLPFWWFFWRWASDHWRLFATDEGYWKKYLTSTCQPNLSPFLMFFLKKRIGSLIWLIIWISSVMMIRVLTLPAITLMISKLSPKWLWCLWGFSSRLVFCLMASSGQTSLPLLAS